MIEPAERGEGSPRTSQLRPNTWRVLELAVEEGVALGYNRAHKHLDNPTEEDIKRHIEEAVLGTISEWFHVDD